MITVLSPRAIIIYGNLPEYDFGKTKITEDSIGIFNDGLTECLPMGKRVYESDMIYPFYSVGDDMKGWNAKFEITRGKTGIRYRVYPSEYSNRDIDFTVPFSYFEKLKSSPN